MAAADELEALARDLDDRRLTLDPAAAIACLRLVTGIHRSPLFNPALPADDLRSRVHQIRSGFRVESEPELTECRSANDTGGEAARGRGRLVRPAHFLAGVVVGFLTPIIAGVVLGSRWIKWSW